MSRTGDEIRAARSADRQRLLDKRLASGTMRGTLANAGWSTRGNLPSAQAAAPFSGGGGGGGAPSVVVAASNAGDLSKSKADFICTGTNDQVTINAAIAAAYVGAGRYPRVVLTEGVYQIAGTINFAAAFVGSGIWETYLDCYGSGTIFNATHAIADLSIDAGGQTMTDGQYAVGVFGGEASNLQIFGPGSDGVGIRLEGWAVANACYVDSFRRGITMWSSGSCKVIGGHVYNSGVAGIENLFGYSEIVGTRVVVSSGALIIVGGAHVVVAGCTLDQSDGAPSIQNDAMVTVSGNLIDAGTIVMDGDGTIVGNTFVEVGHRFGSPWNAIEVTAATDVLIDANQAVMANAGSRFVEATGTGQGPSVTNNQVVGTGSSTEPILVGAGVTTTLVNGNTARGLAGGLVSDAGTGTSLGAGNLVNGTWV